MTFSIVLRHMYGELRTVEVEYVSPNLVFLSIRWGQCGIYDLNLKLNTLTARSAKARRKGKADWSAVDIEAVRTAAKQWLGEKHDSPHDEFIKSVKRHVKNVNVHLSNIPLPRSGKR